MKIKTPFKKGQQLVALRNVQAIEFSKKYGNFICKGELIKEGTIVLVSEVVEESGFPVFLNFLNFQGKFLASAFVVT